MEGCVNSKNGRHDGVALCPRETSDCKNLGLHTLSFGLVSLQSTRRTGTGYLPVSRALTGWARTEPS